MTVQRNGPTQWWPTRLENIENGPRRLRQEQSYTCHPAHVNSRQFSVPRSGGSSAESRGMDGCAFNCTPRRVERKSRSKSTAGLTTSSRVVPDLLTGLQIVGCISSSTDQGRKMSWCKCGAIMRSIMLGCVAVVSLLGCQAKLPEPILTQGSAQDSPDSVVISTPDSVKSWGWTRAELGDCSATFTDSETQTHIYPVYFHSQDGKCELQDAWDRLGSTTKIEWYQNAKFVTMSTPLSAWLVRDECDGLVKDPADCKDD